MRERMKQKISEYSRNRKLRSRLLSLLLVLSLCTVWGVFSLLRQPAISMENRNPIITAERVVQLHGEEMKSRISAVGVWENPETVIYLIVDQDQAQLSDEIQFQGNVVQLTDRQGGVALYREQLDKNQMGYWFTVASGETEVVYLDLMDQLQPVRTTTAAPEEALNEPAEAEETPAPETPADAEPEAPAPETPADAEPEAPAPETPADAEPEAPAPEPPADAEPEAPAPETPADGEPEAPAPETPADAEPEAPAPEPPADAEPEAPAPEPPADAEPEAPAPEPPADAEPEAPAPEPPADAEPEAPAPETPADGEPEAPVVPPQSRLVIYAASGATLRDAKNAAQQQMKQEREEIAFTWMTASELEQLSSRQIRPEYDVIDPILPENPYAEEEELDVMVDEQEAPGTPEWNSLPEGTSLNPYITSVVGENTVYNGTEFLSKLKINFNVERDFVIGTAGQVYIDLPAGVTIPENLVNPDKNYVGYDENGIRGFQYRIVKHGDVYRIEILFDENYVNEAGRTMEGGIRFSAMLGESTANEQDDIHVEFNNKVSLDVDAAEIDYGDHGTVNTNLSTNKTGGKVVPDPDGKTYLTYQVEVSSTKGTDGVINFNDILTYTTNQGFTADAAAATCQVSKAGTVLSPNPLNISAPKDGEVQISGELPKLEPGESYIVTYSYPVVGNMSANSTINVNNTINAVTVTNGGLEVKGTDSLSTNITNKVIEKKGEYVNGQVKWSVIVNGSGCDVSGTTMTDTMFGTNKVRRDEFTISPETGVKINTVLVDGVEYVSNVEYLPINGGVNTNTYNLTYFTHEEAKWEEQKITNTVELDGGLSGSASGQAIIPGEGSIRKKLVDGYNVDSNGLIPMDWTTEVKAPRAGFPANTVITDTITDGDTWETSGHYVNLHYMRTEEILEWKNEVVFLDANGHIITMVGEKSIKDCYTLSFIRKDNGAEVSYSEIELNTSSYADVKFSGFKITLTQDLPDSVIGNGSITYDYSTVAEGTSVPTTEMRLRNAVEITGGKRSEDSYVYKTRVQKMDGNNKTGSTNTITQDGLIKWRIRAVLDREFESLRFVEQIPAGLTVQQIYLTPDQNASGHPIRMNGNGTLEYEEEFWKSQIDLTGSTWSTTGTGTTLSIKASKGSGMWWNMFQAGSELNLYVVCKVDGFDQMDEGQRQSLGSFENRVTIRDEQDSVWGVSTQTQTVEGEKPWDTKKKLVKSGLWDNESHRLKYTMDINPMAETLNSGKTIHMLDEMSYNSANNNIQTSLVQDSVKLYYAQTDSNGVPLKDANNKLVKGEQVPSRLWSWKPSTVDNYGHVTKNLEVTLSDSTAYVFEYAYDVDVISSQPTRLNITNSAKLEGDKVIDGSEDSEYTNDEWREQEISAEITTKKDLTILKVNSEDYGTVLSGAQFRLNYYVVSTNQNVNPDRPGENAGQVDQAVWKHTVDGDADLITDAEGKLSMAVQGGADENNPHTIAGVSDVLYVLEEIQPPAGYLKSNELVVFVWKNDINDTDDSAWNRAEGDIAVEKWNQAHPNQKISRSMVRFLTPSGGKIWFENEYSALTVSKIWQNADGTQVTNPPKEIQIQLYQKVGENGTDTPMGQPVTLNAENHWSFTWESLAATQNGQSCLYKVAEVNVPEGYEVSYTNNEGIIKGQIVVLNKKHASTDVSLSATKTLDHTAPAVNTFTFRLDQVQGDQWIPMETKHNDASTVAFTTISYFKENVGDHWYRITEQAGEDPEFTYDTRAYYAKITITQNADGTLQNTLTYYSGAADAMPVNGVLTESELTALNAGSVPQFSNFTNRKVTLEATKLIRSGTTLTRAVDQNFTFQLHQLTDSGWVLQDEKAQVQGNVTFDPIAMNGITGSVFWYKICESSLDASAPENAWAGSYDFDSTCFIVKVDNAAAGCTVTYYKLAANMTDTNWYNNEGGVISPKSGALVDALPPAEMPDLTGAVFINQLHDVKFELPETGGMGTDLFTLSGTLLMAAAAGTYLYLKRKNREEEQL